MRRPHCNNRVWAIVAILLFIFYASPDQDLNYYLPDSVTAKPLESGLHLIYTAPAKVLYGGQGIFKFAHLLIDLSPALKQHIVTILGNRKLPDKTIFKYDAKFIKYD